MSNQSSKAGDMFRSSKKPLTEYEEEQLVTRKNLREKLLSKRTSRPLRCHRLLALSGP
jgi:hypothetical protein